MLIDDLRLTMEGEAFAEEFFHRRSSAVRLPLRVVRASRAGRVPLAGKRRCAQHTLPAWVFPSWFQEGKKELASRVRGNDRRRAGHTLPTGVSTAKMDEVDSVDKVDTVDRAKRQ